MSRVTARSIVLQTFPYSDTSKILRLYCREYGLQSVIAKGALRPRSRFGGILEPFTEGDASFFLKESRDLHTLSGFDLVRSRQSLGRSLAAFSGASVMAELVLRCTTPEPQPALFDSFRDSLDTVAAAPPELAAPTALGGIWLIVLLLGFRPQLEECVGCGRALRAEEPVRFDVEAGGVACTGCRPVGRLIDPASRAELMDMLRKENQAVALTDPSLQLALLSAYIEAHLSLDRPLRSLELFVTESR